MSEIHLPNLKVLTLFGNSIGNDIIEEASEDSSHVDLLAPRKPSVYELELRKELQKIS